MNDSATSLPIVVGIDGPSTPYGPQCGRSTKQSSRDAQLALTCVIDPHSKDLDRDYAFARHVLHKAWVAVEGTGKPVKLESIVLGAIRSLSLSRFRGRRR